MSFFELNPLKMFYIYRTQKTPKYFSAKIQKKSSSHTKILIIAFQTIMLSAHFFPHFLHKSIFPFQKWTKKMSKNENPKYFCAKTVDFLPLLRI